jgi:hypothetical protein
VTERPGSGPRIEAGEEANPGRCHVELPVMPVGTFGPRSPVDRTDSRAERPPILTSVGAAT